MRIDLSQRRKDYFRKPDARRILLQYLSRTRFLPKDLLEMDTVVGTKDGDLEKLLNGKSFQIDHFSLVEKIKCLGEGQLLVLPTYYRINAGESREAICYSMSSLVDLDKVMVRKPLLGRRDPGRRLSSRQRAELSWHPEEVVSTAFRSLHKYRSQYIDRLFIGYCWTGGDDCLRVVPIMNNIKGAELRAFQNLAYYQLGLPVLEKEVRRGVDAETGERMTKKELSRRESRLKRYAHHLQTPREEGGILGDYVARLEVRMRDLIEFDKRSFKGGTGRNFTVPSRTNVYTWYKVKIVNVPVFEEDNPEITSTVWDLFGECYCLDKNYRSDRRESRRKEFYFCPHEIASLHGLKAVLEQEGEVRKIHSLPFLIPSRELVDYIDRLRYQAVLLEFNKERGKFVLRALNDTEIGRLVMMKMIADPYESNGTTDRRELVHRKYDPHTGLIEFIG